MKYKIISITKQSKVSNKRALRSIENILKAGGTYVSHAKIDWYFFDKLIEDGISFQDALICAQVKNIDADYFVTRDKELRRYFKNSKLGKSEVTKPKGMKKIAKKHMIRYQTRCRKAKGISIEKMLSKIETEVE